MRFLTLVALLTLLCTRAPAQILTVSEEITMRTDTRYDLIGTFGGQTLLLQDRDTKHLLTGYDRSMNQRWEKELEMQGRNIRLLTTVAAQDGSGFHLVYLFRESGRNYLQLDAYNPAGNLRDSVTLVDFGGSTTKPEDDVVLSDDETKALLMVSENGSAVRFLALDLAKMELLYDQTLSPERFYLGDDFLQAEITNTGQTFFALERDNFRSKRKKHEYEIWTIRPDLQYDSFRVPMGDSLTYDVYFRYDNRNDRLVAGGLYTIKDFSRADGYFWLRIDPANPKNSRPVFNPFPLPLVKNVEGKRYNKKDPGLDELSVRDLVLRHDGGALMITEKNRQLERRSAAARAQVINNFGVRPLVDFHYDELIAFSIHPDGRPHWSNILHKRQYSQDDNGAYSSYFLLENPRSLRFLFNDEIRFENTVSEYVVNGRGEFDRNALFHTRDLQLRLQFRDGVQVAANELVLPSTHRNKLRLVKVTYEGK